MKAEELQVAKERQRKKRSETETDLRNKKKGTVSPGVSCKKKHLIYRAPQLIGMRGEV